MTARFEKLEKLESRRRKPKTYEEDVKKLQAAIVKVKKLVERYQPKSQSTWKGIDIADAGAIALKIDKETKEKETGAAIGNVVNQEITRLMDPEAEARAAEKKKRLLLRKRTGHHHVAVDGSGREGGLDAQERPELEGRLRGRGAEVLELDLAHVREPRRVRPHVGLDGDPVRHELGDRAVLHVGEVTDRVRDGVPRHENKPRARR